jgi:hypothetical protein
MQGESFVLKTNYKQLAEQRKLKKIEGTWELIEKHRELNIVRIIIKRTW